MKNSGPNILFIIIDSLRVDRITGSLKTAKTPNLDKLINTGVFFDHTIAPSDTTNPNIGSIFTAQYPFRSGVDMYRNHKKSCKFFKNLNENDFFRCATVPNTSFFRTLTKDFEHTDFIEINPNQSLEDGVGDKLLKQIQSNSMNSPWIHYVHLLDLHPTKNQFLIPEKYNDEKFGKSKYDQTISIIDEWIGKILAKVNLNNTLIIVSSDHGEYISEYTNLIHNIDNLENVFKKLKNYLPFLESMANAGNWQKNKAPSIGTQLINNTRKIIFERRKSKLKKYLTESEIRSLNYRLQWDLFDEIIRVPLIFVGYGIKHVPLIDKQIHQMDIVPTINDILQLPNEKIFDGRSLLPFMKNITPSEKPIYLETATTKPKSLGNVVGIRTPEYKMYKPRLTGSYQTKLFDLKNDPLELNNLAKNEPIIIKKLSKMIFDIQRSDFSKEKELLKKRIRQKRRLLTLKE